MKNAKNTRLHVWELALLLALAAAILWGAASLSRQEDLGRKVIRLHVIANSDSPEDQALKLRVRDRLEPAEFPTKDYDGFSLPAGKYLALRVIIGEGRGQNWWCVVFPPLCTAAACDWQDAGRDAGLAEDDLSLMAEEDQGYQLRFRSVELWEKLRQWLGK